MHSLTWRTSKFIHSWHILLNLYEYTGLYWLYDHQRQQWFAQSRQWEGTDVIQEMIHSAGSIIENEDGTISDEIDEGTPILLFCRNLGVVSLFDLIYFYIDNSLTYCSTGICLLWTFIIYGTCTGTYTNTFCMAIGWFRDID